MPEYRELATQIYKAHMLGEKVPSFLEVKLRCKDGIIKDVELTTNFIQYNGKPAVMAIARDITECKRAEKIIEASEIKFRTVFENASSAIFISDAETGEILDCNKLAEKLIGRPRKEIIGMHQSEVHPKNETEKYKAKFAFHIQNSHIMNFEGEVQHKDGRRVPVYIAAHDMEIEKKKIIVGFFLDMTERKKIEEEQLKIEKLEAIGVLAGGIAHDFNNLLTGILGNLSLAELSVKKGNNLYEILAAAKTAAKQAGQLTQQLLTFSKGGAPIKEQASISELIKETACFCLRGSNVRCDFSMPDDLWPFEVDKGQISQVIYNLIINANHAMPGGGTISIRTENVTIGENNGLLLKEGNYIKISIKDQGIGIPKEYLKKIFDPYFTTKQKGSGLGLATCHSIVSNHGGHIVVESEPGVGTTFIIFLPAVEKEIFTVEYVDEESFPSGGGRILFMDDEQNVTNTARRILIQLGYEVETAQDGAEALELYRKAKEEGLPFDAVILDLTVPGGMGGEEAIKRFREIDPQVKGIVSSGYSNDPIMAEYENYGFNGVVAKPYEIKELSKVLYKVINGKEESSLKL